jgi:putative acetyltransferase
VIIRPETDDDRHEISRIVGAAFGSDVEPALVERIRATDGYVPELALVAERDGRVVGHVMVSGASLRSADGVHPIVMLAPLAVDPTCQGDGVGGALVREVTRRAGALGHPFVVLEGSPAYYSRFGFEPAARYDVTMPLPDWAPREAAQLLRLPNFTEASVHGGGAVVYSPAFDGVE